MSQVNFSDLKDKVILITGATRGIGKGIALNLARQNASVVFNYREGKENAAKALKEELLQAGATKVEYLCFDLNKPEQMKEAIKQYDKDNPPISGLVNNAGVSKDQLALRLNSADVDSIIDTNLKGAMLLTSYLSRGFLKAQDVSVVNMSSVVGLMGNASQASYAASKAGLLGFTKSYAKEMSPKRIRCNAICPGFIATDMTDTLEDRVKEAYLASIPLKRFGDTNEVANLVAFLLSSTSAYITGEVIKIDGGLYI